MKKLVSFCFSYKMIVLGCLSLFALMGCQKRTQTQQSEPTEVLALNTLPFETLPYPVTLDYEWIVFEKDYPHDNNIQTLSTCHNKNLITVNGDLAETIKLVGAARLEDGRTIGMSQHCQCRLGYDCFTFLDSTREWGLTSRGTPRHLYTSVTASGLPLGATLYIAALDGMSLPDISGKKHNGYVRVDSRNYFEHNQINLFVGTEENAKKFSYLFGKDVTVEICTASECARKVQGY